MINGHGDDLHAFPPGLIKSNFSTNILAPASHDRLMKYLASVGGALLRSYPEPEPLSLEAAIAGRLGLRPDEVMVTAGATQAIYLIASSRPGCSSAIVAPAFREYEDACRMASHSVTHVADPAEAAYADMAWICSPANPTGIVTPAERLRPLMERAESLTVVDVAYAAYAVCPTLTPAEAVAAPATVMLRSLTKDFGVPGLRIGYAVGSREALAPLRARRMPWAVGALPLAAALWLLGHEADYAIDSRALHAEALRLGRALTDAGIEVSATDANFLLGRLPDGRKASELKRYLAFSHGILIRDASNFHGLTPSHFRIAAQTPAEGDRLTTAINQWLNS